MKSADLPLIDIIQINESIGHPHSFSNDLVIEPLQTRFKVAENCEEYLAEDSPMSVRINGLCLILLTKGEVTINVDYLKFPLQSNNLFFILPDHILEVQCKPEDLEGKIMVISKDMLSNMPKRNEEGDNSMQYMFLRKNPSVELTDEEVSVLDTLFTLIRKRAEAKEHLFHKEAIQSLLFHLFFELKNIIFKKNDIVPFELSRKEELFQQFLKLMFKHSREEHSVSFYAGKMCITPQYLSAVLKELTGKTTNNWIDHSLILDAKILLKTPNMTVQQVSDMLNFSNQSTFGKFFKKHTGQSPAEFRKGKQ
ncbi:MAG TPA: AraC family transcriptional regulator [Macellibacteroides fermentans]|uniref:helix-turn-helix domain-containing protein n=1 Tax=Macellibacteroides fermentans TaxID=879969 RepID=UPI002C09EF06|nr:AraC family transcriptional regulator [Macellibacteroides fermentans]